MMASEHYKLHAMLVLAAVLFAACPVAGDCPPRYEVTAIIEGPDCGGPWGNASVWPWGMNDHGDIVG